MTQKQKNFCGQQITLAAQAKNLKGLFTLSQKTGYGILSRDKPVLSPARSLSQPDKKQNLS